MIRLLLWLLLGFLVYRLFLFGKQALQRPSSPPRPDPDGEEMVHDPQCGTYVPRSAALSDRIGNQTLFFCSDACRQSYRQAHPSQGDRS